WADLFRESDVERAPQPWRGGGALAAVGLIPTALAAFGAGLAVRDVRRGRRRAVYIPVLLQALVSLVAFAVFSWRVPIWSALKASYLLGASLAWGACLARGVEGISARGARAAVACALLAIACVAAAANLSGAVRPRRADAPATGAVYFYFGDYAGARRVFARLAEGSRYPVPWLDNLAAVELAEGRAQAARSLYARAAALEQTRGRAHAYRRGQLAVAAAVSGDRAAARDILDAALADAPLPELRANRGVLRLLEGDAPGAEEDLRGALAAQPELVTGWLALAALREREGQLEPARAARARAARAACRAPRGYPYAVGDGEVLEWGVGRRWLLYVDEAEMLALALPAFHRDACRRLGVKR
ncbi:MAG TPA: hypothetical protein VIY27_06140, partial [Myxococcota bacterium]